MNNVIILNDCIKEYKRNNELQTNDDETFEFFSIGQITKKSNLSFEDIESSIVDGTKDGGIDCFMMLVDETPIQSEEHVYELELNESSNVRLLIGQVKNTNSLKESVIDKIYISISQIFDLENDENSLEESFNNLLVEKILVFRKLWRKSIIKNSSISIEYFYSCKAETKNETETFVKKTELIIDSTKDKVQNCISKYSTFSSKELLEIYSKRPELELELILKELPVSITYENGRIGYIGVVPIKNYFDFITDDEGVIRESIFEENIRHFQGEVDINKKIRETLEEDLENDFWWLNNGITVIASHVGQLGKTLHLKDVQIVNGLQTSFTIGKYYKEIDNEQRSILIKIIVSNDKTTIDKIISATNRQTPVNPALLRATDDIQRKIEMYFEQKGYYYDRRKNFYKNLGKPISKIFSIQITAQSIHAIMNFKPSEARARPTTLIKQQESYEKIFAKDTNYQVVLNCCIINRLISDYIKVVLEDKEEKSIARTFIHHIGRVIPSYLSQKSHLSATEIGEVNISDITDDLISDSFEFLQECIEGFKASSTTQNINSISKSGPFEEYISSQLVNKFNT
ncbi:MAG: AIPR family protein [Desulfobacterales bacterium]|nr:AIPR family protein [Desulfobacterales bacterium]